MCRVFDRSNIDWLYRAVVRPAVDTDWKALEQLVCELSADHAQFMAICDRDSATVLVGGCDDSQLEKNVILIRSKFLSDVHVEAPQVRYLETIRKAAEVDYSHRKRTGSTGQFARVRILIEPLETDSGFEFENKADNDAIPKQYIPGVEKGIQSVLDRGVAMRRRLRSYRRPYCPPGRWPSPRGCSPRGIGVRPMPGSGGWPPPQLRH